MTKFIDLYNLVLEELTNAQKRLTDEFADNRAKGLSFGPIFKEERTYFPLKSIKAANIEVPNEIEETLDEVGFYITDYRAGIAMKKAKPGEKKDLRQIKIGKILQKLNQPNLLKQFNERLGTSKKDIQNIQFEFCITHNPYDIAGMSTDRNWTSCMELDNGEYKDTPLYQVQYGGMVAYLISAEDKNIEKPFARIAIKRFIPEDYDEDEASSKFIFLAENRIYGDVDLADELTFQEELIKILEKSNSLTSDNEFDDYIRDDEDSYSDTYSDSVYYMKYNTDPSKLTLNKLYKLAQSGYIFSKEQLMYILNNVSDLTKFISEHLNMQITCNNIDRELIETFLQKIQLNGFINDLLSNNKNKSIKLSKEDIFYLFEKYASKFNFLDINFFLKNTIKFTLKDIDYILEHSFNSLQEDALITIFSLFKFDKQTLEKYLEKSVNKHPNIFNNATFCKSQDFPAETIIKLHKENKINKKTIEDIFKYDRFLSDENKNKLEKYIKSM